MDIRSTLSVPAPKGLDELGGVWDSSVREAIHELFESRHPIEDLSTDQAWALLGWCESAATLGARTGDVELVTLALFATLLLRRKLDTRDVLVVGAILRCASVRLEMNFEKAVREIALTDESRSFLRAFDSNLPATHCEVGEGPGFEYRRESKIWSESELLRRLGFG